MLQQYDPLCLLQRILQVNIPVHTSLTRFVILSAGEIPEREITRLGTCTLKHASYSLPSLGFHRPWNKGLCVIPLWGVWSQEAGMREGSKVDKEVETILGCFIELVTLPVAQVCINFWEAIWNAFQDQPFGAVGGENEKGRNFYPVSLPPTGQSFASWVVHSSTFLVCICPSAFPVDSWAASHLESSGVGWEIGQLAPVWSPPKATPNHHHNYNRNEIQVRSRRSEVTHERLQIH